jgi:hypothetical protein
MRAALFFMCFSTIGVWGLGPVMAILGRESPWYDMAIQFFLHFQFNGWFVFGVLALVFKQLDHLFIPAKLRNAFFYTLIAATVLTYAQVVVPDFRTVPVLWADGMGVHLQLAALLLLMYILFRTGDLLVPSTRKTENMFLHFILVVYAGKAALQYALFFLDAGFSYTLNRYLSIGFIHLTLLGVFTLLLAVFYSRVFSRFSPVAVFAWKMFALGFLLSEGLIFYQGLGIFPALPNYHHLLFGVSALMTTGVWIVFANFILKRNSNRF